MRRTARRINPETLLYSSPPGEGVASRGEAHAGARYHASFSPIRAVRGGTMAIGC